MSKLMFRQGDVLIESVEEIPKTAKKEITRENGRAVLAHGEVTGHSHALAGKHILQLSETGGRDICYLKISHEEAFLKHEEHSEIRLPIGNYKVTRQREYTLEAIRNVAD